MSNLAVGEEALAEGVKRYHDGSLSIKSGTTLPRFCVDCGAACVGDPIVSRYKALPARSPLRLVRLRWLMETFFGAAAEVGAFVCDQDVERRKKRRVRALVASIVLPLVGFVVFVKAASPYICVGLWVVGAIASSIASAAKLPLDAIAIERDGVGAFTGASDAFATAVRANGARSAA